MTQFLEGTTPPSFNKVGGGGGGGPNYVMSILRLNLPVKCLRHLFSLIVDEMFIEVPLFYEIPPPRKISGSGPAMVVFAFPVFEGKYHF